MKRHGVTQVALLMISVVFSISAAADDGRWKLVKPGVVEDTFTEVQWTQRDNLGDVNWQQAKAHCDGLKLDSGGWQLPTLTELSQVYSGAQSDKVSCGAYKETDFTCRANKLFYLTGPVFWSDDAGNGSSDAWYFGLDDGNRNSFPDSDSIYYRALCVRRRS